MSNYYSQKLSAERLRQCYELAPTKIQQYQEAEVDLICDKIKTDDYVLDLGCGYGRIFKKLSERTQNIVGIDISYDNLCYAKNDYLGNLSYHLIQMNAANLGFKTNCFDLVFCIQNGISAFKEDPNLLISEARRITKPGEIVLFSSYTDKIWEARLEWFKIQSEYGLVGEIDYGLTGDGVIICKDGFRATTFDRKKFEQLTSNLDKEVRIFEVDNSSIFCEIKV